MSRIKALYLIAKKRLTELRSVKKNMGDEGLFSSWYWAGYTQALLDWKLGRKFPKGPNGRQDNGKGNVAEQHILPED